MRTSSIMDAIAGLLDGPRARGAFLLRSTLAPPWSMRIADEAPLTFLAVVRGEAVVLPDDGDAVRLHAGDACLLRALPSLAVIGADALESPLIALLAEEIVRDAPGQEAVLDRLLDLLLIAALRAWLARDEAEAPGWYRAHADPVVGHALRLIHDDPAHPWTVAELAREAGVSRAALARRFNELVGEPPMAYLAGWRIALAADLLREPGTTIGAVAEQVGYGSPFALSTAFKRVRGMSPAQYRAAAA